MTYGLIDIGGTKTRVSITTDLKEFVEPIVYPTPENYEEGINQIVQSFKDLTGENINAISLGLTGTPNREHTELIVSPHLKEWAQKPIVDALQKELNTKVHLENDTALVGLGEAAFGAGKDFKIVVYITVSTGLGGAKIVSRTIEQKAFGFEPGHHIIDIEGEKMITLEEKTSGTGIQNTYNLNPLELEDPKAWEEIHKYLAIGINNVIAFWSPEVVVIGGGVGTSSKIEVEKLNNLLEQGILRDKAFLPEIRKAELEDFGGIWGGISLLKSIYSTGENQGE